MKTKSSTKPIFFLLLMLGALWWSGCVSDDSCTNWTVQKNLITESQAEFFPYEKKHELIFDKYIGNNLIKEVRFKSDGVKKELLTDVTYSYCDTTIDEEWDVYFKDIDEQSFDYLRVRYDNTEDVYYNNSYMSFHVLKSNYDRRNINGYIWHDSIRIHGNNYINVIEINGPQGGHTNGDTLQAFFNPEIGLIKLWIAKTDETYILK